MNKELDLKLCEKYPKIFSDRHGRPMETAMCWGFECGDGWYKILDKLCAEIHRHLTEDIDYGVDYVQAVQVKEKFGGLRFYITAGDNYIYNLITKAEEESTKTCEICGEPGEVRGTGWLKTLCDKHTKELKYY